MMSQDVISVRIPKRLREKVRKYNVNWKEVVLEAIESKIRQLETEEVLRKIDELNKDLSPSKIPAWKLIREDRNASH